MFTRFMKSLHYILLDRCCPPSSMAAISSCSWECSQSTLGSSIIVYSPSPSTSFKATGMHPTLPTPVLLRKSVGMSKLQRLDFSNIYADSYMEVYRIIK